MQEFLASAGAFFKDMLMFSIAAILLENTIFSRALGTSTALFSVRKKFNLFTFGIVMTTVMTLSSLITYYVYPLLKDLSFKYYVLPIVYVFIIGAVYVIALLITATYFKKYKNEVLSMIHVTAFNCAVLGALLLASDIREISLGGFLGFGIGTSVGFTLATFIVSLAYERLSSEDIPSSFRGFPITMIYIGIVSLAIYGLIGHGLVF